MKRCPDCRRNYTDETLNFCLDDGATLLDGPASFDGPQTAILHETDSPSEAATRAHIHTTAHPELIPTKRISGRLAVGLVAAVTILAAAGFTYIKFFHRGGPTVSFESAKFTRVTNAGRVLTAAISPDGKWLAYSVGDGKLRSLWLQQVAVPGSGREVISASEAFYRGMTFSPDGDYLFYNANSSEPSVGSLFQIPVNGGSARKVLDNIAGSVSFSPDGKRFTYFGFQNDEDQLMVANADGSNQRTLASRRGREYLYEGFSTPSWSPDGRVIATSIGWSDPTRKMGIAMVDPDSGAIKTLDIRNFTFVDQVNWLADGSGLLILASETEGEIQKIWHIAYPSGEAQKLAHGLDVFGTISLTKDSSTIASVRGDGTANVWVAPIADISHGTQITHGSDLSFLPTFTPDGRIVFTKRSGEVQDLFIIDQTGGTPKQLTVTTNAGVNSAPVVSPDGKTIVFVSDRAGNGPATLWKMNIDGSEPKQLTTDNSRAPVFSPDGRDVIYVSLAENRRSTWKVSVDGGAPVRLTTELCSFLRYSHDGKQFLCSFQKDGKSVIGFFGSEAGPPVNTVPEPGGLENMRWMTDGRSIIYTVTDNAVTNFWIQPINGGPAKRLTDFTSDHIDSFNLSPDGKQVAFSRGTATNDVVLITGFKK